MRVIGGHRAYTTAEAANYLGVSPATLRGWRHEGYGPNGFRVGRKLVYYLEEDLRSFIDQQIEEARTA